ncbi:MAG: hypothetical protein JST90_00510 [Bacteroidetes bacterium]|nr:hypothetical protein [Bacteroidota bacterium]
MRIHTLILIMSLGCSMTYAQPTINSQPGSGDLSTNIDMLAAPQSPAFTLLGISPSAIDRPSTPTDFMVSLQNATKNYTIIPNSYSAEFTPMMFVPSLHQYNTPLHQFRTPVKDQNGQIKLGNNGKRQYYYSMQGLQKQIETNVIQTTVVSIGFAGSNTTPSYPRLAIGLKTSLATGHVSDEDADSIDALYREYHNAFVNSYDSLLFRSIKYNMNDSLSKMYADSSALYRSGINMATANPKKYGKRSKEVKDSIALLTPLVRDSRNLDTLMLKLMAKNTKPNDEDLLRYNFYAKVLNHLSQDVYEKLDYLHKLDTQLTKPYTANVSLSNRYMDSSRYYAAIVSQFDTPAIKAAEGQAKVSNLSKELKNYNIKLVGFKCDVGGGLVIDYPFSKIDTGVFVSRWGIWVNAGYEGKKVAFFAAIRGLGNSRDSVKIDNNILTRATGNFDFGGRFLWFPTKQLSVSAELLCRSTVCKGLAPIYQVRYMFIAQYVIAPNNVLSFNVGKDFNNNLKTNGSVVAALNLALGFGSKRTLSGSGDIKSRNP